jgi:ribokinase
MGTSFEKNYGGKGANQAVMASRLGSNVYFCTKLGLDDHGEDYKNTLIKEGCSPNTILRSSCHTGIASIIVDSNGENCIVVVPGANYDLNANDVEVMLSSCSDIGVLICQNEIPLSANLAALQKCKSMGILTIFNPAPMSNDVFNLLEYIDILCQNSVELSQLATMPTNTDEEIVAAAQTLMGKGPKVVIVTLGGRGCCLITHRCVKFFPATEVTVVDTTGAGDCFVGISIYFHVIFFSSFYRIHRYACSLFITWIFAFNVSSFCN